MAVKPVTSPSVQQKSAQNLETEQKNQAAQKDMSAAIAQAQATSAPTSADGKITVVDLNSAMGLDHNNKNKIGPKGYVAGGENGMDFNEADMSRTIDNLFGNGRDPDVITMQEVAVKGATGTPTNTPDIGRLKGIKQRLEERTGDKWDMYFNAGGEHQYYRGEPGKTDGIGIKSAAGTVIFVRTGPGSDVKSSSAILPMDQKGMDTRSSRYDDYQNTKNAPTGALVGVRITTADGKELDVYTTHQSDVAKTQNKQMDYIQNEINTRSGSRPVILTGDFNTAVDESRSLEDLIFKFGYTDASKGAGNTASKYVGRYMFQFDHVFTRGIAGNPAATAFEAAPSDHKGLVITVDTANLPPKA